ncbi:TetR/AcrR family transcriptional regulator [Nocardia goodfellowii]|uniref:AcrR family transcriptional regulator n=1 Tax=Nocardia goodfellowii TaxID=882446 RepID=A0ABS4QP61_9NOCA|nr:TetR/AcrR family transcriptional regulator [Nocardia goodfellowii]MBP2193507.1 AcrR family transcriptional regulator [Nocardia goodfellowii]
MSSTRTRMTATDRRAEVLAAAVSAFAESGYAATKTDEIARRAGVSQPYVIRLFGTKQQLFIAVIQQVCGRIEEIFRAAVVDLDPGATPAEAIQALGKAYDTFLEERDPPLGMLHGFTASGDPVIGDAVRAGFGDIYDLVRELTGASVSEARRFIATGMLLTVMSAMRVVGHDAIPATWATEIFDDIQESPDPC